MSRRWSYKVAELKSTFPGLKADAVQQVLDQIGRRVGNWSACRTRA